MICSTPGCDREATIQYQRLMTAAENGGVEQITREDQEWRVEQARAKQRQILAELEEARPHITPNRIHLLDRQITAEQARLDAITDPELPPATSRPNVVALFACDEHTPADPDRLHAAHCQPGACCDQTSDPAGWREPHPLEVEARQAELARTSPNAG